MDRRDCLKRFAEFGKCTRATHQAIFETALQRPFKVDIVESLRRGGMTCHFAVRLS